MLKIRWDEIFHITNFWSDVYYAEVPSKTHRFFRAGIEIFAAIFAATELRVFLCESIYSNSALHTTARFSDI